MPATALIDLVREELKALERYEIPHPEGIRAKLDANENPWPLDPDVAEGLGRALARVELHRYPDGDCRELRAVVARQLGCDPATISFGNGSDELIALLIAAFARPRAGGGPKARVGYPVPSFVVYRIACLAHGVAPLEIALKDDFTLDAAALDRALVAGRPNVIFFALPNNPTGTLWPREEIVRVVERHPDTLVVADEAYLDYSGETLIDILPRHPNLVIMRTLSKLGLASLRCGYLVAHPQVVTQVEKIRPPYNLGSLNQAAAAWLLANHADRLRAKVDLVVKERERVVEALAGIPGVRVFPTRANFVLIRYGEAGDGRATALWKRLAERGVLVRNFDRPGPLQGCLRVTVGTPEENTLFLEAMAA